MTLRQTYAAARHKAPALLKQMQIELKLVHRDLIASSLGLEFYLFYNQATTNSPDQHQPSSLMEAELGRGFEVGWGRE